MDKSSPKRQLNLLDFGVLSLIFFGYFTFLSIWMYLGSADPQPPSTVSFTDDQNIQSIILELVLLTIAGTYLWWRRFDWSLIDFSVNWHILPVMICLILLGGAMVDICIYGSYWLQYNIHPFSYLSSWNSDISNIIEDINIWLLLFALLNGFFEEFFFMGLVFAVGGRFKIMAIVASVLIRFGFHIYQGLPSALGIALMGLSFILVRQKYTSIVPFVLVHSLFDLFGAGVLFWIYSVGHF